MKRIFAPVRWLFSPVARFFGRRSKAQLGVIFLVAIGLCSLALFNKSRLMVNLKSGEQIQAEFAGNYKLREYVSRVKIAGIKVGTVTRISPTGHGTVKVNMRVDNGTKEKLGMAPVARVRPATILGGSGLSTYVDLRPGGGRGLFNGTIPTSRTGLPVELDRVLEVFTDVPRSGFASSLRAFDEGFDKAGAAALGSVVEQSPAVLPAATKVLAGMQGTSPGDLAALVNRLGKMAATLTETDGEIESVLSGASTATKTLGRRAADFEALLADLPTNMRQAKGGLDALSGTLDRLASTAPAARAAVQKLNELLDAAAPVLAEARPLLADVRPLLAQLDPTFARLAPTSSAFTKVLDDLDGDVIGRIQSPILSTFTSNHEGSSTMVYQEFAFFLAGLDGVLKYTDQDGAAISFQSGGNEYTVSRGQPNTVPDMPSSSSSSRSAPGGAP